MYTFIYFYKIVEQQRSIIIATDSFSDVYFVLRHLVEERETERFPTSDR